MISENEIRNILSHFELFNGMPDSALKNIIGNSIISEYSVGQIIFEENSFSDAMFLIVKGRVKIYGSVQGFEMTIRELNAGEFLAEDSVFTDSGKTTGAKALTPTILIILYRDDIFELIESSPKTAALMFKSMLASMSARVSSMDKRLQNVMDWGLKE